MNERGRLEAQTRRNLEGLELERAGQIAEAVALYEQNVADGFEGDWPYGRLVAYYERLGRLDEAERVLLRAIEVFSAGRRRSTGDRRATLQAFRGRLRLVQRVARQAKRDREREARQAQRAAERAARQASRDEARAARLAARAAGRPARRRAEPTTQG